MHLTAEELQYLKEHCSYLNRNGYLEYLEQFRLRPHEHLDLQFLPSQDDGQIGDLHLQIRGLWVETILYETLLLALVSKAYFKFCDTDWTYDGQQDRAYAKATRLIEAGCVFSDFGARRRRDYTAQDLVIRGLTAAANDAKKTSFGEGAFTGTSNVHFAMKYGVSPIGTVAHEWFMGIASATADYPRATELALRYWLQCYGEGVLGVALTDTFGTPHFLEAFDQPIRKNERGAMEGWLGGTIRSYAAVYTGVRQDSGDPEQFVSRIGDYYEERGLEKKRIVFSDALNVDKCIKYREIAEKRRLVPSFGIGTHLTSTCFHRERCDSSELT